jgi:hypothetical protein
MLYAADFLLVAGYEENSVQGVHVSSIMRESES